MDRHVLDARRHALEEAFFAQHNESLRQQLLKQDEVAKQKQEIAAATGATDPALIDRLHGLGVRTDTLVALELVPLLEVAWADGELDPREQAAILKAAETVGIAEGWPSYKLLAEWLQTAPQPHLTALWRSYLEALTADMTSGERARLREDLMARARNVAEAAGGFLGLVGKVSAAEAAKLRELEAALS